MNQTMCKSVLRLPLRQLSSNIRNSAPLMIAGVAALFLTACTIEPEPIDDETRAERVRDDLAVIRATRFIPDKPITLYEAMARAVSFNLESRIREVEAEIADAELEHANFELLPAFDTSADSSRQNRPTSRTTDRTQHGASAGLAWNILDLGVSYARAQQQANQVLLAAERRRKAYNDILRDVRLAYWRAASAGRLLRDAGVLSGQIQMAVRYSSELQASQVRDAKVSIGYRRALLDSVRQMVAFRREVSEAKVQLAELLNIPPGVEFELAEPSEVYAVPSVPMTLTAMELHALHERAEIRNEDYQKRADSWRMREQLYELLPGIDLNFGGNYSTDSFLLNNTWTSSGIQVGMNLFNLFSIPSRLEAQEKSETLADHRRMAMAVAVMVQVNLSYRQHQEALYQFALTRRIASADRNLTGLARQEARLLDGGFLEVIEAGAREMRTGLEEHRAYIDVIRTHNELMHAVGVNEVPTEADDGDLNTVAAVLRAQYAPWDRSAGSADRLAEVSLERLIETALPSAATSIAETPQTEVEEADFVADQPQTQVSANELPPLPQQHPLRDATLPLTHFVAQVGAYKNPKYAAHATEQLLSQQELRRFADLVHTDIMNSEKHGALYVVRVGPFFQRQEAAGLCDHIKQHKIDCLAVQQTEMSLAMAVGKSAEPR